MGKSWDGGDIAFRVELWAQVLRVLKPGGHLVAFSGTRTYHRMACAIEDAGFEVRDMLSWLYGSGFPKSLDVSKAIDKAAGAEREVIGVSPYAKNRSGGREGTYRGSEDYRMGAAAELTAPGSDAAREWSGWGTALKPAQEPICFARKPLAEGTVAANVLAHGTGALNIDGCRVSAATGDIIKTFERVAGERDREQYRTGTTVGPASSSNLGRWPANVVHDGSPEVLAAFPDAPGQQADISLNAPSAKTGNVYGKMNRHGEKSADARYGDKGSTNFAVLPGMRRGDSGSAARFFYTAKADADDRIGSKHPTVKPVDLMRWLVRLVTPPKGVVLDPFAGTGTTGAAAFLEGFSAVLIEREEEYRADIARRMDLMLAGPEEKKRALTTPDPVEGLPLFGDTP